MRKLKQDNRGPIICLVGPPGVGKTSLGRASPTPSGGSSSASRSAACATRPRSADTAARTSARFPAASSRHQAGAAPTIRSDHARRDRQAGAGLPRRSRRARCWRSWTPSRTSPSRDHYLELPFDLSRVLFIATANVPTPSRGPSRPHGGHPAARLHRSGQARDRRRSTWSRGRSANNGVAKGTSALPTRPAHDHPGLHPRGRRPRARTQDRLGSAARSPTTWPRGKRQAATSYPQSPLPNYLGWPEYDPDACAATPRAPASPPGSPGRRRAEARSSSRGVTMPNGSGQPPADRPARRA